MLRISHTTYITPPTTQWAKRRAVLTRALLLSGTLLLLAIVGHSSYAGSQKIRFASGPEKVSLIELYTSEGCSSCPPADRWLSALGDGDALWTQVVPVAFHVSYWDRLGWPDRFAQRQFDTRQRSVAARANAGVYTPGLFKDGTEFRRWRRTQPQSVGVLHAEAIDHAPGQLTISHVSDNEWEVTYQAAATRITQPADRVFAAVLGNQLTSVVRKGENAGKQLAHDFVVLQLESAVLTEAVMRTNTDKSGGTSWHARFTLNTTVTPQPAVAAWVTTVDGRTVQAVGGAL